MKAKVYIEDIAYLKDEKEYMAVYMSLPDFRREEVDRMLFDKDRKLSAGAFSLLVRALRKEGMSGDISFEYGSYGKPYLRGNDRYFNLSHSGEKVMCIISDCECGCDIEEIREVKEGISRRFFSDDEMEFIGKQAEKLSSFFSIWTLKEAYIKARGTGLSEGLDSFSVIKGVPGFELHKVEAGEGYAAGCCIPDGCKVSICKI